MSITEFRNKSIDELKAIILEKNDELLTLRLKVSLTEEKDHSKLSKVRKLIAQVNTVINEKMRQEDEKETTI